MWLKCDVLIIFSDTYFGLEQRTGSKNFNSTRFFDHASMWAFVHAFYAIFILVENYFPFFNATKTQHKLTIAHRTVSIRRNMPFLDFNFLPPLHAQIIFSVLVDYATFKFLHTQKSQSSVPLIFLIFNVHFNPSSWLDARNFRNSSNW